MGGVLLGSEVSEVTDIDPLCCMFESLKAKIFVLLGKNPRNILVLLEFI